MTDNVPTAIIGSLEPFDPDTDNWLAYTERLEQFFSVNRIADDKKVATLLTVIGKKAYDLLRNLLAPEKPSTKGYDVIVQAMQSHLDPQPLAIAQRFKFHQRNQKSDETISQFVVKLRKCAEHCDFQDKLDEALRDRLVCGLRSETIQKRLLAEKNLTLASAIEIAQGMEAATRQSTELRLQAASGQPQNHDIQLLAKPTAKLRKKCYRCGRTGHLPSICHFRDQKCRKCGKLGHIAKVCNSREAMDKQQPAQRNYSGRPQQQQQQPQRRPIPQQTKYVEGELTDDVTSDSGEWGIFTVQSRLETTQPSIIVQLKINNEEVVMELDTGASLTIMSENTLKQKLPNVKLQPSTVILKTYSGEQLKVLGQAQVKVTYKAQEVTAPLIVVAGEGPILFGRNWLQIIQLDWKNIRYVTSAIDKLLQKHDVLFKEELGTMKDIQVRLAVKSNAVPKFCRARSAPYALRPVIEQELTRLEKMGALERVKYSDWATPVVPIPKPDGMVRVCGDFKITVNPALHIDQHPIPKAEDLFATLAGGKKFSKLDLSQAYQQMLLHPDDRKYTTINTHLGLFQYTRLPFGIASAPAIFQQAMEKILQGIPKVICYLDDVLITGQNDEEHLKTLETVFCRLGEHGLRLKKTKCEFLKTRVEYLGYCIDADGLHKSPAKVKAIVEAPRPQNQQQLRSFLGLVNYYGKFISSLSTIAHPLNQLLCQQTRWKWSQECEQAFLKLKDQLSSDQVLAHYDSSLPVRLACDASQYGVGAVLSHLMPDGTERPIAYGSRTLTKAERNYAQIEREAAAIIFGIKKFHPYIYGRQFTLITDHKPLTTIFSPKSQLPALAAARLQRWAIILSAYQYEVEFRATDKHANADGLSRLPLEVTTEEDALTQAATLFNLQQIERLPVKADKIAQLTANDPILSKVMTFVQQGWPSQVQNELKPYYTRKDELTVEANCLLWGRKVIVPEKLQSKVLEELHTAHPGVVRMKSCARIHVWWPGIDKKIEEMVKSCLPCQSIRNKPPLTSLHCWNWPNQPWHRLHLDFLGPFLGATFLIVVDAYSKWLEVIPMSSTTAERTITELRKLFATHGLPTQVVTDNGAQFTSQEFAEFLKLNGIHHYKSAPYHPATNGEAERYVQTFKQAMRAAKDDPGTLSTKLMRFLLAYRTTPNATTGVSPAELLLGRTIRTRLTLLKPDVSTKVQDKQASQKQHHDKKAKERHFQVGQSVLVENNKPEPKWVLGTVLEKLGDTSYKVQVGDLIWKRHVDQLLQTSITQTNINSKATDDDDLNSWPPISQDNPTGHQTEQVSRRYPNRLRRPPERYSPGNY